MPGILLLSIFALLLPAHLSAADTDYPELPDEYAVFEFFPEGRSPKRKEYPQEEWDCSPAEKHSVLEIWQTVWGGGYDGRRTQVAVQLFKRMFDRSLLIQRIFARKWGLLDHLLYPQLRITYMAILMGVDATVNFANSPPTLRYQLEYVGRDHAKRKEMLPAFFDVFMKSFADVFEQSVVEFDATSWYKCFRKWNAVTIQAFNEKRKENEAKEKEAAIQH